MADNTPSSSQQSVLFLCTGNSCRSQMAEALVNQRLADSWQAYSAGTKPAGYVHPKALQVLAEIGVDHQGSSKHVNELRGIDIDLVVTVCDSARESCPVLPGSAETLHTSFFDPALAEGTEEERMSVFRRVRDEIRHRLLPELTSRT